MKRSWKRNKIKLIRAKLEEKGYMDEFDYLSKNMKGFREKNIDKGFNANKMGFNDKEGGSVESIVNGKLQRYEWGDQPILSKRLTQLKELQKTGAISDSEYMVQRNRIFLEEHSIDPFDLIDPDNIK